MFKSYNGEIMSGMMYTEQEPEKIYTCCNKVIRVLGFISLILIVFGLTWGMIYAPEDRIQGNGYRIIYLHVPAAILSVIIYIFMAFCAVLNMACGIKLFSWLASSAMLTGMVSTIIALVTGAIWGKPMWGTWWVWDARLTSELILLFLYISIISLNNSFNYQRNGEKIVNIFIIIGLINIPIIHYSVDWWNTLHQGATDLHETIDISMRVPLRITIAGFFALFITLTLMQLKNIILQSEINKYWVYKHVIK